MMAAEELQRNSYLGHFSFVGLILQLQEVVIDVIDIFGNQIHGYNLYIYI